MNTTDVTHILNAIEKGDAKAAVELLPLVYEELRLLANQKMSQEARGRIVFNELFQKRKRQQFP